MDTLKSLFPYSFKKIDTTADLIIAVFVYLVAGIFVGALIGILAKIWIVGIIFGIIGSLIDLYIFAGIVILFLNYFKVLK